MIKEKRVVTTLRIPEELWEEFKMICAHKRKSMNKYMEELIKKEVEKVKLKK